jgi:hypothetical protein
VGVGVSSLSGVSRNRGGFVKCVAIQKRMGIPALMAWLLLMLVSLSRNGTSHVFNFDVYVGAKERILKENCC